MQWKIDLPNMCLLLGVEFESIARKAWDLFTVRLQIAARSAVNKKRPTSDVRKFAEKKTHIGQEGSSMFLVENGRAFILISGGKI